LTYSHASTFEREAADVDLPALVADAAQLLSVPDGCVVACRGVERVRCNRVVAETVVRNLIQNSLKHHHDGAHARVTLSAELDGGMLVLRVSDDGPGIAPEHRERIFEPFSTLAPRDRVEGSGMGLAIVRRMLRASGGDIELGDPVDGRGACFVVTLPVEATAPGEDPAT
ncbi:MAG: sensor histidine kinase, partial [Planctomycetes bacterium]|nr:sensor histidine kinase [Planctomycetota bacterium]